MTRAMTKPHLLGLISVCFAVGYAIVGFVAHQSAMFLVVAPPTISAFAGGLLLWRRLGEIRPRRAAWVGLLAGCMSAVLIVALDVVPEEYSFSALRFYVVVFLVSPALITWGLFVVALRAQHPGREL